MLYLQNFYKLLFKIKKIYFYFKNIINNKIIVFTGIYFKNNFLLIRDQLTHYVD